MDDLKLLRDALPEMASIINAEEGQVFSIGSADALLILQRKIKESDMKEELGIYNAIFAKQHGAVLPRVKYGFLTGGLYYGTVHAQIL